MHRALAGVTLSRFADSESDAGGPQLPESAVQRRVEWMTDSEAGFVEIWTKSAFGGRVETCDSSLAHDEQLSCSK